jgi:hypothetical protein
MYYRTVGCIQHAFYSAVACPAAGTNPSFCVATGKTSGTYVHSMTWQIRPKLVVCEFPLNDMIGLYSCK